MTAHRKPSRRTSANSPVSHQMTGMTVMTLSSDRVHLSSHDKRPDYKPDAAERGDGVYALLEDHELSPAERARMERGRAARAEAEAKANGEVILDDPKVKRWTPKAIMNRLIALYARFTPSERGGERRGEHRGDQKGTGDATATSVVRATDSPADTKGVNK